tara:strand:+ start:123 stop:560 length:438 start_codon:yes stop_codon:yes gene_type:complete
VLDGEHDESSRRQLQRDAGVARGEPGEPVGKQDDVEASRRQGRVFDGVERGEESEDDPHAAAEDGDEGAKRERPRVDAEHEDGHAVIGEPGLDVRWTGPRTGGRDRGGGIINFIRALAARGLVIDASDAMARRRGRHLVRPGVDE